MFYQKLLSQLFRLCWCGSLAVWCAVLTTSVMAQSQTRPSTPTFSSPGISANSTVSSLIAAPKPQDANPFLPTTDRDMRLPVILDGYSVVALREQQAWLPGSESHQLVFDGQLYWFASPRERAMFAATPQRYVPALSGDCVVTFAESNLRRHGKPQYGILHDQRLFFFLGLSEQQEFQASPERYEKVDLGNEGLCLVSQRDNQRLLPGLSETTVIVDGLRYRFAGSHQRQKFLLNMTHYGVVRPDPPELAKLSEGRVRSLPSEPTPQGSSSGGKKKGSHSREKTTDEEVSNHVMGGYCPVSIHDQGIWVAGEARYRVAFDGLSYLMAGEAEQKLFAENPSIYVPALAGHCVVTEKNKHQRVLGNPYHASPYEGRLFLFAGAEQKKVFKESPATYMNVDLVEEGHCIVTLVDEGKAIAGLPELLLWHQGKRHLFASKEQQSKFRENTQRYQRP